MATSNDKAPSYVLKTLDPNITNPSPSTSQLLLKELISHSYHSFRWHHRQKKAVLKAHCKKAATLENSLKTSHQFKVIAKKNKEKELAVLIEKRLISPHIPCDYIGEEELDFRYIKKAATRSPQAGSAIPYGRRNGRCVVKFHLFTKGGVNIVKILWNPALKKLAEEMTVYASKGDTVRKALKRDGRFLKSIFKKNFVLSDTKTKLKIELSNLVDDLDGKTFQITLFNKLDPPSSLEEFYDESYDNETSADTTEGNRELQENLCSKAVQDHLSSQFDGYVTQMKTQMPQLSVAPDLVRLEFGRMTTICQEVKTMKDLMKLSNSVCQVRINDKAVGSGFLFFGSCILTNAHVIKDAFNSDRDQLHEKVSVHFSFLSLADPDAGIDVVEVVAYDYIPSESVRDWALLKLNSSQNLPSRLLKNLGFLRHVGGISIIGHPQGGVKKIGACLIIPPQDRSQHVENELVPIITRSFFETKNLTYNSSFYEGSSGSPVFDNHCNVVAMHTGGYLSPGGERKYFIEYAQPLSTILEWLFIRLVQRKRFDILREFCGCPRSDEIRKGVKKLVESRNLTLFTEALRECKKSDHGLNEICDFFLYTEPPEPMDIH